jgi:hypothetical protein
MDEFSLKRMMRVGDIVRLRRTRPTPAWLSLHWTVWKVVGVDGEMVTLTRLDEFGGSVPGPTRKWRNRASLPLSKEEFYV